jgi:Transglycosylase SLT domain
LVTALSSVMTVTGAAIGAMVYYHSSATTDPLAMVVAQVATGKSGALLMHERQKIILDNAATQAFTVTSSPKVTSTPAQSSGGSTGSTVTAAPPAPPVSPGTAESIAQSLLPSYGFGSDQWSCLYNLWEQESGWNPTAENASGAYGIPQALPGSKMASAGPDWETDATTQIKWGLGYIQSTYGTPCSAWDHEEAFGWY